MKTRGTANIDMLTDGELRHLLASAALDVYEASLYSETEMHFAVDTLERFTRELRIRRNAARIA